MSRSVLSALAMLVVISVSLAQEFSLPSDAKGEIGRLIKLSAVGSTEIHWDVDESLAKEGEYYIDTNGRTVILPCSREGTFKVRALSVIGGKLSVKVCIVTVGKDVAVVKTKGSSPPSDLVTKLSVAYKQDLESKLGTEQDLRKMTQVYKQGKFIARNVRNKTGEDVFNGLRQTAVSVALDDKVLQRVRQVIAEHLATKVTWELEKEITAEQRDIIATLIAEVAKALEGM
jgi:hypothetical protein